MGQAAPCCMRSSRRSSASDPAGAGGAGAGRARHPAARVADTRRTTAAERGLFAPITRTSKCHRPGLGRPGCNCSERFAPQRQGVREVVPGLRSRRRRRRERQHLHLPLSAFRDGGSWDSWVWDGTIPRIIDQVTALASQEGREGMRRRDFSPGPIQGNELNRLYEKGVGS
jgi:hypothetical protein